MKIVKIAIFVVIIVITAFAIRNKISLNKCAKDYLIQKNENIQTLKRVEEIEKAVIKTQSASMEFLGEYIEMGNIEQIHPENELSEIAAKQPKLLLVFSELGCNVCQDEETRFAVNIATEFGSSNVIAVVHATNPRYVRNYIRLNQVNFPVYFSKDESFMVKNNIMNAPIIFVIDEEQKVIAAHIPVPGHSRFSEPMHQFCYRYFSNKKY